MADRSIVVRLRADIADYEQKIGRAAKKTSDFVAKNEQSINTLSNGMGLVGAGLVGVAAVAVSKFSEFDAQMSSVQAATMESTKNMGLLRAAAMDAGARTVYSATEAAGAVENLAKAGVSTADILAGGLDGALDLAASGAIEVADAAEVAASTMVQFGLTGRDVTHIADVLAAGAGKAQGGVLDLGNAMKYAGIPAAQLGISLEETAGTLALFASNGIIGEQAGTSFRSMLMSLTAPTKIGQKAMDEYGISMFDAAGNFIGMEAAAGVLQDRLGSLTDAERTAALGRIVGNEAIGATNALMVAGAEGVREWTEAVDDQGYAAEQAAIRLDNLRGDWEGFTGALDTAFINLGSAADGPLRGLVQHGTDLVNAFADAPDVIQGVTMSIVGGGGLALLGLAGIGKLTTSIGETIRAAQTLGITMRGAALGAGALAIGVTVGALALANWAKNAAEARAKAEAYLATLDSAGNRTDDTVRDINAALAKAEFGQSIGEKLFGEDPVALLDFARKLGLAASDLTGYVLGESAAVEKVTAARREYLDTFGLQPGDRAKAEDLLGILDAEAAGLSRAEREAARKAIADEAAGVASDGLAESIPGVTAAMDAQAEAAEAVTEAMAKWLEEVASADASFVDLLGGYQSIIDKNREFAESAAAETESAEDSWEDFYDGMSVALGDYLAELEAQVQAQQQWETNMLLLSARVSQGVIDELARLGPEGAPLVADLVNASDEELSRLEGVYAQRSSNATGAFAENLRTASPVLAAIMASAGLDAANAAAAQLASGEMTMQQVIDAYDLDFAVDADTGAALSKVQQLFRQYDNKSMTVYIDAVTRGGGGARPPLQQANGGLINFADGGGIDTAGRAVRRESMIADGGRNILWAEPETGWEAYISGKPSMRNRNVGILGQVANRFGYGLTKYAAGGMAGAYTPKASVGDVVARMDPADVQHLAAAIVGASRMGAASLLEEQVRGIRSGVR